jgi:hypothetical protein
MGDTYRSAAYGIDRAETLISMLLIGAILWLNFWLRAKVRGAILREK